jgi:hypothetical protein
MPPLLRPSIFPGKESWFPPVGLQHIIEGSLLLALFITALRSILVTRRRGMMADSAIGQDDLPVNREKKLAIHQRKDSYQEEVLHHAKAKINGLEPTSEKTSILEPQGDAFIRRPSLDQEPNQYLQSLQQETLQPTLSPIYPWISPPQNLPGPYDAPYYPVPLPTIKAKESLQDENQSTAIKTEASSEDVLEELETITYTRRLPTNSQPEHKSLLEGTVTVSSKGWRRTQWTVTAG